MLTDYQHALDCQRVYDGTIPTVNVAGIDYAVITDDDTITIIAEGSHDIEDAKRDLHALMVDVSGFGRVHSGAWEGVPEAVESLKPRLDGGRPIRFLGHSLGAMRAPMMTWELGGQGYTILECVTFESPLWGDEEAVANFNAYKNRTYQNYLNLFQNDFFTMVPLHLPDEPYVIPPNRQRYWSAPTANNEYKLFPENIQCHSMKDCVIPGVAKLCGISL